MVVFPRKGLRHDRMCEVINPAKDAKLDAVAARHQICPIRFRRVGGRLRRVWPLLP